MSDVELLRHYQKWRDNAYLGELLDRYTLMVLGVSMKYLKDEEKAKDAVQQIFLKVIHAISQQPVTYFKSWLYMVTKNYCLMELRQKNITAPLDDNTAIAVPEEPAVKEKELQFSLLEEGIEQLSSEQKKCIEAFYFEKKSYQTIAQTTGFSLLQVKSFIQNGKRNLKKWMEQKTMAKNG